MLQGHAVPMNALGCDTFGKCDTRLLQELGNLIQQRRQERLNVHKPVYVDSRGSSDAVRTSADRERSDLLRGHDDR